mmetsp:Transcript_39367/g.77938  ORF Transcript_39367/g.77938 Transcript_39367/m.77938 type:complete len:87 (-) Transcript_39367:245-505(-)
MGKDDKCCRSISDAVTTLFHGGEVDSCNAPAEPLNACTDCPHTHDWVGLPGICGMVKGYGCNCTYVDPNLPQTSKISCESHQVQLS